MFPYSFRPPVRYLPNDDQGQASGGPVQSSGPIMESQPGVADDPMMRARPVQRSNDPSYYGGMQGQTPYGTSKFNMMNGGMGMPRGFGGGFGGQQSFNMGPSASLFSQYMSGINNRQFQPQFENSLYRLFGAYLPSNSRLSTTAWAQSPEVTSAKFTPDAVYGNAATRAQFHPWDTNRDGSVDMIENKRQGWVPPGR